MTWFFRLTSAEHRLLLGFAAVAVLFALLPGLLFVANLHDKERRDFPHSGVVSALTPGDFVLHGKKDRSLRVTYTASTTVSAGSVVEGQFVQVFGDMVVPGTMAAERIQVLETPKGQRP